MVGKKMHIDNNQFTAEFKDHLKQTLNEILTPAKVSFLEIELTGRCNNNCEYCGVGGPENSDLPIDSVVKFIEKWELEVRQNNLYPVISLTGGDPLLYSHLNELLSTLNVLGIDYMFKTNAHSIGLGIKQLPKLPTAVKLTIPDGINCGRNHDSMADLLNATNILQQMDIDVIWQASVHNQNMTALLNIIKTIEIGQPITLSIGRIFPFNKRHREKYAISTEKYHEFLKQLINIYSRIYKKGIELRFKENLWIPLLGEANLLPETNGLPTSQCCDCFQNHLSVDRDGKVYPCGLLRKTVLGDISHPITKLFLKRIKVMNAQNFECFTCKYFQYCGGCAAAAETMTGLKTNRDPHCFMAYLDE
jgi:radical SAM additional 4Fe4S-binding domain